MERVKQPIFSSKLTPEEFAKQYWYKEELIDICLANNLSSSGTKAELVERIKGLLQGKKLDDKRRTHNKTRLSRDEREITLDMKLIPEGFKFNRQARQFFAKYYNKEKFSFTKAMAAALREAERTGNHEMTVADLIAVYEGRRHINNPDEKSYQWNQFVKDFNADPASKQINENRMRVAAALWRKVRDVPGEKVYTPDLLREYLQGKS